MAFEVDHEAIKQVLANIGREVAVTDTEGDSEALFVTLVHTFKLYVAELRNNYPGYADLDAVDLAWQGLKENVECEYELSEYPVTLPSLKAGDDAPF